MAGITFLSAMILRVTCSLARCSQRSHSSCKPIELQDTTHLKPPASTIPASRQGWIKKQAVHFLYGQPVALPPGGLMLILLFGRATSSHLPSTYRTQQRLHDQNMLRRQGNYGASLIRITRRGNRS